MCAVAVVFTAVIAHTDSPSSAGSLSSWSSGGSPSSGTLRAGTRGSLPMKRGHRFPHLLGRLEDALTGALREMSFADRTENLCL